MRVGPEGKLEFVWQLSTVGMLLSIFAAMFGWIKYWTDSTRAADCTAAFGSEATPMRDVDGGTLCHVGEGVQIAPDTDAVSLLGIIPSYLSTWPHWAYGVIAVTVAVFVIGAIVIIARLRTVGGGHV